MEHARLTALVAALLLPVSAIAGGEEEIVYDQIGSPTIVPAPKPVAAPKPQPPRYAYSFTSQTSDETRVIVNQGVRLPDAWCVTDNYRLAMNVAGVTSTRVVVQRTAPVTIMQSHARRVN